MKKKALKFTLFAFLSLLTILLTITAFLYIRKDRIAANLIGILNDNQQGQVYFKDLSFTPFKHFPKISLKLQDLEVTNDSTSSPYIHVDQAFGSIDVIDLVGGKIDLSQISLENGFVDLVVNADGVLNVAKTFASRSISSEEIPSNQELIDLDLEEINIRNIDFSFTDARSEFSSRFSIKALDAGLKLDSGLTDIVAKADFVATYMRIQNRTILENIPIELSTGFLYDQPAQIITAKNGVLSSGEIGFKLDGTYDLLKEYIDVVVSAEQNALGLVSILLEDDLIEINKNLANQGTTYFQGTIEGSTQGRIPNFSFDFGADNIIVNLPDGTNALSDFDLKGSIATGTNPDFSEAVISLESLEITSPNGSIKGSFSVANFTNPTITLDSEGKIDLNRFSRVLNLDAFDSLAGNLSFETKISSTYDSINQFFPVDSSTIYVELRDASLGLADAPFFHHVNAKIINTDSLLLIKELRGMIGSSTFAVDGSFEQLFDFIFTQNQFNSTLHIQSEKFNIQDFGIVDELHEILDFNARMDISYQQEKDRSDLHFYIEEMYASPSSYPVIEGLSGAFHLVTTDSSLAIEIKDLKANTSIGELAADADMRLDALSTHIDINRLDFVSGYGDARFTGNTTFDSSKIMLAGSLTTNDIWVNKVLKSFQGLPLHDTLRARLTTSMDFSSEVRISDTLRATFLTRKSYLRYIHPEIDTVLIENFNLDIPEIHYVVSDSFIVRDIIQLKAEMSLDHAKSNYFDTDELTVTASREGSKALLEMTYSDFSGDIQSAQLEIDLEQPEPAYTINYIISNIDLASFFTEEQTEIIDGKIDFEFKATSRGTHVSEIAKNTDGLLSIEGENIQINGFDLDEILKNYKKSQHFRLTDVGAFMLVGPFGPLVTKGFDFARIAKINPEDSTIIKKFYSHWNIKNELLQTEDVAFTTSKSRIAFDGSMDLAGLSIPGITVYVLDARGCSLMDQTVSGSFAEPELGELNVVGTLFGAVINVFKLAAGNQCKPVYNGVVPHPPK